nr:MAG TPA: hypothetical protein [Caudoviricetes sp.]
MTTYVISCYFVLFSYIFHNQNVSRMLFLCILCIYVLIRAALSVGLTWDFIIYHHQIILYNIVNLLISI